MYLRTSKLHSKLLQCFKGCRDPLKPKVVNGPHIYGCIFRWLSGVLVTGTGIMSLDFIHRFHNNSSINMQRGWKSMHSCNPKPLVLHPIAQLHQKPHENMNHPSNTCSMTLEWCHLEGCETKMPIMQPWMVPLYSHRADLKQSQQTINCSARQVSLLATSFIPSTAHMIARWLHPCVRWYDFTTQMDMTWCMHYQIKVILEVIAYT
jgi:hypothetical protein